MKNTINMQQISNDLTAIDKALSEFNKLYGGLKEKIYDAEMEAIKSSVLLEATNVLEDEIEERKNAEAMLERALADNARAQKDLEDFIYITSHDMRAPLVNLKGFAVELEEAFKTIIPVLEKVLEKWDGDEDDKEEISYAIEEDIPEAIEFINSSVKRLDGLTSNILELSKVGKTKLKFEKVNTRELVEELRDSLQHQIQESESEVIIEDMPIVMADYVSVQRILGNLLDNALKYLEDGRPGRIRFFHEDKGDEWVFYVEDNGRGIKKEDMEKVFQIFRRAGKQDKPGEGMGMSYVKTLVARHGGELGCTSEFGVGTTFFFSVAKNLSDDD